MANRKPLIDDDGEVRELTAEDLAQFRPFSKLPLAEKKVLRGLKRGPQKLPTKELISIRLSQDVVHEFRATGPGWQSRVDGVLKDWLKKKAKRTA